METRALGPSNLHVSLIGLGCNNFGGRLDLEATRKVVDKALELGVTHIDTADIYGGGGKSEELLGDVSRAGATTSSSPPRSASRWPIIRRTSAAAATMSPPPSRLA